MITRQDIERAIETNQITSEITQVFLQATENDKHIIFNNVLYGHVEEEDNEEMRKQLQWMMTHMKNVTLYHILVNENRSEHLHKFNKLIYEEFYKIALSRSWSNDDLLKMLRKVNRKTVYKQYVMNLLMNKRSFDQIFTLTLQDQTKPFLINSIIAEHDKKTLPDSFQWYYKLTHEEQKKLIEILLIYGKDDERIEIIFHDMKKLIPTLFKEKSWEYVMIKVLDIGNIKAIKLINEIKPYADLFKDDEELIKSYYKEYNGFNFNNFLSIEKFHWLRENHCPQSLLNEMMEAMYLIKNNTEGITVEEVLNYDKQYPGGFDKEVFAHVLSLYVSKTRANEGLNKKSILIYDYLQEYRSDLTEWLDHIITNGRQKVTVKKYIGEKETFVTQISTHQLLNRLRMNRFNKKLEDELITQIDKPKNKL